MLGVTCNSQCYFNKLIQSVTLKVDVPNVKVMSRDFDVVLEINHNHKIEFWLTG